MDLTAHPIDDSELRCFGIVNASPPIKRITKPASFACSLSRSGPFGSCQIHGSMPMPQSESDDLSNMPDIDNVSGGIKSPIMNNPAFSHSKCPTEIHRSCFCVRFIAEHTKLLEDSTKVSIFISSCIIIRTHTHKIFKMARTFCSLYAILTRLFNSQQQDLHTRKEPAASKMLCICVCFRSPFTSHFYKEVFSIPHRRTAKVHTHTQQQQRRRRRHSVVHKKGTAGNGNT